MTWFAANNEGPTEAELAARYGTHRPGARMTRDGTGWVATCSRDGHEHCIAEYVPTVHTLHVDAQAQAASMMALSHGPEDDIYSTSEPTC